MDAVALAEQEFLHARVPAAGLVTEVGASLQHFADAHLDIHCVGHGAGCGSFGRGCGHGFGRNRCLSRRIGHSIISFAVVRPNRFVAPQPIGSGVTSIDQHRRGDPERVICQRVSREPTTQNKEFKSKLDELRLLIDDLDDHIIQDLASRMKIAEKIGEYKKDNNVTILQVSRWDEIVNKRISMGSVMGLSEEFTKQLLELIHKESIRRQTAVMNSEPVK